MKRWLLVVLTSAALRAAPGDPQKLQEGDWLARCGSYAAAEAAYASLSDRELQTLLSQRRLAVATARFDVASARQWAEALQVQLQQKPDAEMELRLHLTRGLLAYRLERWDQARSEFARVAEVGSRLHSPGASLARFEERSFRLLTRPEPWEPADFGKAFWDAVQLGLTDLPTAQQPYWPLDESRFAYWGRQWVRVAIEQSWEAWRQGQAQRSWEWKKLAIDMGERSSAAYRQTYQALADPEAAFAATAVLEELAHGLPTEMSTPNWLASCKTDLEASDRIPQATQSEEQTLRRAGYFWAEGRYQFWQGRHKNSLEALQQARQQFQVVHRVLEEVEVCLDVGAFYLHYQAPEDWSTPAQEAIRGAAQGSQKLEFLTGAFMAASQQGEWLARRGLNREAEKALAEALQWLDRWALESGSDSQDRRTLLMQAGFFYDAYIEVLLALGKSQEAQRLTAHQQQLNAHASLQLKQVELASPQARRALEEVEKARATQQELQAQLQAQGADQAQLHQQASANRQQFYQALAKIQDSDCDRLIAVRPATFSKIQGQLPDEVLLVAYYAGPRKTYLFTATRQQLRIHQVPLSREQLDKDVRLVREDMIDSIGRVPLKAPTVQAMQRLYEHLIGPLEGDLRNRKVLAIVPSGSLYYLPFAALQRKQGEYLIERVAVVVETSSQLFEIGAQSARKPHSLLALANPDGSLAGAKAEVERFAGLFPERRVYFGEEASKDKLRSCQGVSVLHLATHGQVDPQDVNRSFLIMAGAGQKLTVGEVFGLNLSDVSLVTLSACKTALGQSHPGAEITTLAQAFAVAGSKSILASLWSVEDEATAALMVAFYQHLLAGESKAQALRAAQMSLLGQPDFRHPYLWSAFELLGDWR